MQVIRSFALLLAASFAISASAQVQQARGKASVTYAGPTATAEDKARAMQAAQLKAVDFYYAEAGESESENFDAVREKILASPDRYILESTVLGEEDSADKKQYSVAVRISLNVANLRNLVRANSAAAKASAEQKSQLVFVFVSREVASTKSFDDRVYKRSDESMKVSADEASSKSGAESERISAGQIKTKESVASRANLSAQRVLTSETGGSTVRRSDEVSYRVVPSANLNAVFTGTFARAGFEVVEAAMAEPATGGRFSVAMVEQDYQTGHDLKAATLQSISSGMRGAGVPYVALGTLDIAAASQDPATGLVRVGVTVNAKLFNVAKSLATTQAAVGPIQFAGTGPDESTARGNALKLAANNAARELASQVTAQRLQ
jgi:hypothetical protein